MIKQLLLTGAFALSIFSASFAQTSLRLSTHSFYNPGQNIGVGPIPANTTVYSFSQTGDTIQATVTNKPAGSYEPIVISVLDPANNFATATYNAGDPTSALYRNISFKVKASVACTLNIALQDNAQPSGYVTDGLASYQATTSWTTITSSVGLDEFKQVYSGTHGNETPADTAKCSAKKPCLVDSLAIGFLQITPNSGNAYNGTIWITDVYLGDSTLDKVTAITAATPLAPTVNVYPNPIVANSGLVTINDQSASSFNITLTNSLGAVVGTSNGTTINAPATAGMYFVTYSANGAATPNTLPLVVK